MHFAPVRLTDPNHAVEHAGELERDRAAACEALHPALLVEVRAYLRVLPVIQANRLAALALVVDDHVAPALSLAEHATGSGVDHPVADVGALSLGQVRIGTPDGDGM